ncbi:MAG: TIGR04283 family arsenosugar biosynthesis glycosyltransferase [Desulfomonilia bacterium]|nr:TIGR04283 family arsenosugar biosynthesis glycosyltransferase [Desulfomonilia bacterium]
MHRHRLLIIFTRYPVSGTTKTRLIPALGAQGAADLQREMTLRILAMARTLGLKHGILVEIHHEGGTQSQMEKAFGHDFTYVLQESGDIGKKMERAFEKAFEKGMEQVVLIGSDCPGITGEHLMQAFSCLDVTDAVFGPAHDGGYYLMGLKQRSPMMFRNIPWGSDEVLSTTLESAHSLGLSARMLEPLSDVDRPEDLAIWHDIRTRDQQEIISVIIAALNEEATIARTVQSLRAGAGIEIIVVDGGSTDGTVYQAAASGAKVVSRAPGRAAQMNYGAFQARGRILLFLHADTLVPAGYDRAIRDALRDNSSVAGSFRLSLDGKSPGLRLIEAGANLRTRRCMLPYGDQGLFMWKEFFLELGGYPEMPILEDVALIREIRRRGHVILLPLDALTSSRRYDSIGVFRTWFINVMVYACHGAGMTSEEIARLYKTRSSASTWIWSLVRRLGNRYHLERSKET